MVPCNTTSCINISDNTYCNTTLSHLPNDEWKYTFAFLCIGVAVLATLENLVVIIIVCRNKVLLRNTLYSIEINNCREYQFPLLFLFKLIFSSMR